MSHAAKSQAEEKINRSSLASHCTARGWAVGCPLYVGHARPRQPAGSSGHCLTDVSGASFSHEQAGRWRGPRWVGPVFSYAKVSAEALACGGQLGVRHLARVCVVSSEESGPFCLSVGDPSFVGGKIHTVT